MQQPVKISTNKESSKKCTISIEIFDFHSRWSRVNADIGLERFEPRWQFLVKRKIKCDRIDDFDLLDMQCGHQLDDFARSLLLKSSKKGGKYQMLKKNPH